MPLKTDSTCYQNARTARIMVFVLAGLLVANLAFGHAWAHEGKGKHHDDEQDKGSKGKGHGKSGDDSHPRAASGSGGEGQQEPPQNLPAELERTVGDSIVANDASGASAGFGRAISDSVSLVETGQTAGVTGVQVAPAITVTSPGMLHVSGNQGADITFDSTVAGRYAISIRSDGGVVSPQMLMGRMEEGANSVLWEGKDASGAPVPEGQYTYYITAESAGGTREPPAAGDGAILVAAFLPVPAPDANLLLLVVPVALAAGTGALLFARRRRSITIFVPVEAVAVVDDIKERYPDAAVANYVDSKADGKRYIGVTIRKGADSEWLEEIASRAKEMAEVDSVNLSYKGKMQVL